MWDDINGFGATDSYSSLYPLVGENSPDSASSEVSYEKGNQFLIYLESVMPNKYEDFRLFLAAFITKYTYKSLTFMDLRLFFNKYAIDNFGA